MKRWIETKQKIWKSKNENTKIWIKTKNMNKNEKYE